MTHFAFYAHQIRQNSKTAAAGVALGKYIKIFSESISLATQVTGFAWISISISSHIFIRQLTAC